jgi:asparagine synthase (glutamine-hydrolysing)
MCGIYGFSCPSGSTFDGARFLTDALGRQYHRGPDGVGVHVNEAVGVGMVRLRIRAPLGEPEPIPTVDAGYAAYNGEVYRDQFGRTPDGGAGEVESLSSPTVDGMYSLLKINARGARLEIQRDPYGIKPLFVREHRGALAFSSEKQPLIQGLGKIRLRREAIAQYLAFGRPIDGLGFYEGLRPIPPGGQLTASAGRIEQASAPRDIARRIAEAALKAPPCHEEVRAAIRDAVSRTLVSNRKVGVAVSGGLDSTILCNELDALGITDLDLISIQAMDSQDGIADLSVLELKGEAWKSWRLTASRFDPATYWRDLRRAIAILGEPTQMTSAPLYLGLAEKAAEAGVVVLLLGEGADELFCGYRSYLPMLSDWSLRDFLYRPLERDVCQRLLSGDTRARVVAALDVFMGTLPAGDQWTQLRAADMSHNLEPLLLRADHTLMR